MHKCFSRIIATGYIPYLFIAFFNGTQGSYLSKTKTSMSLNFSKLAELYLQFYNSLPVHATFLTFVHSNSRKLGIFLVWIFVTSSFQFSSYKTACHMCPFHNAWWCLRAHPTEWCWYLFRISNLLKGAKIIPSSLCLLVKVFIFVFRQNMFSNWKVLTPVHFFCVDFHGQGNNLEPTLGIF